MSLVHNNILVIGDDQRVPIQYFYYRKLDHCFLLSLVLVTLVLMMQKIIKRCELELAILNAEWYFWSLYTVTNSRGQSPS
jgi:hypothetical protein